MIFNSASKEFTEKASSIIVTITVTIECNQNLPKILLDNSGIPSAKEK